MEFGSFVGSDGALVESEWSGLSRMHDLRMNRGSLDEVGALYDRVKALEEAVARLQQRAEQVQRMLLPRGFCDPEARPSQRDYIMLGDLAHKFDALVRRRLGLSRYTFNELRGGAGFRAELSAEQASQLRALEREVQALGWDLDDLVWTLSTLQEWTYGARCTHEERAHTTAEDLKAAADGACDDELALWAKRLVDLVVALEPSVPVLQL